MIEHHLLRSPVKYGTHVHNVLINQTIKFHFRRKGMKVMHMGVEPHEYQGGECIETVVHVEIYKKPRIIKA